MLCRRILELFRHALAPLAEELVHVAHKSSQVLLVVLRQRRQEFVQKSEEFEARIVHVENEIEQFRFDRAQLSFVELDYFREKDFDRILIPDGVEHANEMRQLIAQLIDVVLAERRRTSVGGTAQGHSPAADRMSIGCLHRGQIV